MKRGGIAIGIVVEPTLGGCPWRKTDDARVDIVRRRHHPDGDGTEPTNSPVTAGLLLSIARQSPKKIKMKTLN